MNRGHRTGAWPVAAALLIIVLGVGIGEPAAVSAATPWRQVLPQAAPRLPAGTAVLGSAPADQVLHVDVVLAGRDPSGLDQAVSAVSTPGSSDYRHYITPAQFADAFGPAPAEVTEVSSVLRAEGLSVGTPESGSDLLPVSGAASALSAAFATPLESVQAPDHPRSIVNTGSPSVPGSLAGAVTGVVGLDGVFAEHAMVLHGRAMPGAGATPAGGPVSEAVSHTGTPQACPAAQSQASAGAYTSTQLASVFGLDQVFAQGRTGIGQTVAVVEFERYLASDFTAFESCFGLSTSIRNVLVDGGATGPPAGFGEAALDTEIAAVNAPSASLVVYEAPNSTSDASALDLFRQIANDDVAKVVTTSWGDCEALIPQADLQSEHTIFEQMALQGQTVIAASGDAGSEDCYPDGPTHSTNLAVDDPGSQPNVVSAGGTSLTSASATSQAVWNNCQGQPLSSCAVKSLTGGSVGAGGGGYSSQWTRTGRPAVARHLLSLGPVGRRLRLSPTSAVLRAGGPPSEGPAWPRRPMRASWRTSIRAARPA